MTTIVKNTFIDVEEATSPSAGGRRARRNKTEPAATGGVFNCMDPDEEEDEEESDGEHAEASQPSVAYTKTYDPYDKTPFDKTQAESFGVPVQGTVSPTADSNVETRRTVVKNTFIEEVSPGGGEHRQERLNRAQTMPGKSRRVAFLCGGEGDDGEEDESDDEEDRQQPSGIQYEKTYDHFEAREGAEPQLLPAAAAMQHPQSQPHHPQPQPHHPQPVPMAMPMMQQPQVFTIPIPVGLPAGVPHTIQLQMGLPPGSTIIVLPTNMTGAAASISSGVQPVPVPAAAAMASMLPVMPSAATTSFAMSSSPGSPSVAQPPPPQTVSKTVRLDGTLRITYIVDARKLKVNDKVIISPPFEISAAHPGQYRVIINPSPIKARGGPTFKNTGGLGNVQLKCEDRTEGKINFRVFISDGRPNSIRSELSRGPVEHDFGDGTVCGLNKRHEEWDFNKVVDQQSKTFAVCLDILP